MGFVGHIKACSSLCISLKKMGDDMEEFKKLGLILSGAVDEKWYRESVEERNQNDTDIDGEIKVNETPILEELQFNWYDAQEFYVNIYNKK